MKMTKKIREFLKGLNTDIDILNCIDTEEVEGFDNIVEQIEESGGFDIEIIYYSTAIEYLAQNDNSLNESLEIASKMGYEAKDLNSEILASMLASQNAREDFAELRTGITDFFEDLN